MENKFEIIYKDPSFIVINKPAGVIVNNADTSKNEYTVQDFVSDNFHLTDNNLGSEFMSRGGIVHRLDKETSGALIIALNEKSFLNIQNEFKERIVDKEYIALCHGKMVEEGEINVPIGRLPWNRMRFGVLPQGRAAYTKFKVMQYLEYTKGKEKEILSLLQVKPLTGRTHQIRVHLQYAGYPIFADVLYAGRKTGTSDRKLLKRHFLHASKISFKHPDTGEDLELEAALPEDLANFLQKLKRIN